MLLSLTCTEHILLPKQNKARQQLSKVKVHSKILERLFFLLHFICILSFQTKLKTNWVLLPKTTWKFCSPPSTKTSRCFILHFKLPLTLSVLYYLLHYYETLFFILCNFDCWQNNNFELKSAFFFFDIQ